MLKFGIIGLDQVGKTTFFRIVTHSRGTGLAGAGSDKPGEHLSVVHVPDSRLDRLAEMVQPKKTVHASVEFVDTPGSVIQIARTGTQAATLREMDALVHVLRAFEEETAPAPADFRSRAESVELELILSDLAMVEKRLERLERDLKKQKSPALEKEHHLLQVCKTTLDKQIPLREATPGKEEEKAIRGFCFLSQKPVLYAFNLGEKDAALTNEPEQFASRAGFSPRPQTAVAAMCGKIEAELAELSEAEATEFLTSYGLREPSVARLVRSAYDLMGFISFYTANENECHAWTVPRGTTAFEAAGAVHSDFQKGFIRAEVIKFDDLVSSGNLAEARHRGRVKLEGKEYVVQDGEVVYFRHAK